ncbi:hypothetical protein HDU84_007559 [Entophlyctis sp. JEL0112]|nr:hypothetical protein HDU84_007559 [Entophlyctis sp. JEL0112]
MTQQKERTGLLRQPTQRNFSLDKLWKNFKLQPHIGTEFERGIQISDLLKASNRDENIQDFAVLVSERNVVFLRRQDATFEEITEFVDALGRLTGKPATSGLHKHPTSGDSEFGEYAHVLSSEKSKKYVGVYNTKSELHSETWHSDVTFEPVPSDYALLRIRIAPPEGGDTIWSSAYEVYERLSPAFRSFLEGLTATHVGEGFLNLAKAGIATIRTEERGAPEDVGDSLTTVHPVIRTNPVTGWKGVFVNNVFTKRINELSKDESDAVLKHLFKLVYENHDTHVRFHWESNDVAVWDNRSAFHTATADFDADEHVRLGERVTSLGERPYFDPNSLSRREALGIAPPTARAAHLAVLAKLTK